jgi:hypothetical protein
VTATNASGSGSGTATVTVSNPHGRVLYVATTGSDSNNGTSTGTPFATVNHGINAMAGGDLLLVAVGTYHDTTEPAGVAKLIRSGTASVPSVVRSRTLHGAVLDRQNNSSGAGICVTFESVTFAILDGFRIINGWDFGVEMDQSSNCTLKNCEIDHNGNIGSNTQGGQNGVYENELCNSNTYLNNYVHENGRTPASAGSSGSNLDHGFYTSGLNPLFINNICYANSASGFQLRVPPSAPNARYYNNISAFNGSNGWNIGDSGDNIGGLIFENNIAVSNGINNAGRGAVISIINSTANPPVLVNNNISFGNRVDINNSGGTLPAGTYTNWIHSDPRFVNVPGYPPVTGIDFHVQAGSPAINAGLTIAAVTYDLDGKPRPVGVAYDIGPYDR